MSCHSTKRGCPQATAKGGPIGSEAIGLAPGSEALGSAAIGLGSAAIGLGSAAIGLGLGLGLESGSARPTTCGATGGVHRRVPQTKKSAPIPPRWSLEAAADALCRHHDVVVQD